MLIVDYCLVFMFDVCCLFVMCFFCSMCVVRRVLISVCRLSFVVCCSLFEVGCLMFVVCCVLLVVCCSLRIGVLCDV